MALCSECKGRCRVLKNPADPDAGLGICTECAGKGHDGDGKPVCPTCDEPLKLKSGGWECAKHDMT